MEWKKGIELKKKDQDFVLNAYPYRMTKESIKRWPESVEQQRGWILPIISDKKWLEITDFAIKKDGTLDHRVRRCVCNRHL